MRVLSKSPFECITLSSLSSHILMMPQINSHCVLNHQFGRSSSTQSSSLHTVGLVQRVVEESLRGGRHSGEGSQRRMDDSRRGRGCGESWHRCGRREAVAEVSSRGWRWWGVGILLQSCGGVMAIGRVVVQVRGSQRCCCGAELGLQHQAGLEERLGVDVLLGEPGQTEEQGLGPK